MSLMEIEKSTKLNAKYEEFKAISGGAVSEVWSAKERNSGREVAIKIVTKNRIGDNRSNLYFEEELAVTRKVVNSGRNENIVNLIEIIVDEISSDQGASIFETNRQSQPEGSRLQIFFIIAEYYPEGTILSLLERQLFNLDPISAASLSISIANGLMFLHKIGICHRDLKPENILIAKDQTTHRYCVKITDFGVSKQAEGKMMQSAVGTINYMAPEQLMFQKYDLSVDVWALGCVTYELFTRYQLFDGMNVQDVSRSIITGSNENLKNAEKQGTIPQSAVRIIEKCLKRVPSLRISLENFIIEMEQMKEDILKKQQAEKDEKQDIIGQQQQQQQVEQGQQQNSQGNGEQGVLWHAALSKNRSKEEERLQDQDAAKDELKRQETMGMEEDYLDRQKYMSSTSGGGGDGEGGSQLDTTLNDFPNKSEFNNNSTNNQGHQNIFPQYLVQKQGEGEEQRVSEGKFSKIQQQQQQTNASEIMTTDKQQQQQQPTKVEQNGAVSKELLQGYVEYPGQQDSELSDLMNDFLCISEVHVLFNLEDERKKQELLQLQQQQQNVGNSEVHSEYKKDVKKEDNYDDSDNKQCHHQLHPQSVNPQSQYSQYLSLIRSSVENSQQHQQQQQQQHPDQHLLTGSEELDLSEFKSLFSAQEQQQSQTIPDEKQSTLDIQLQNVDKSSMNSSSNNSSSTKSDLFTFDPTSQNQKKNKKNSQGQEHGHTSTMDMMKKLPQQQGQGKRIQEDQEEFKEDIQSSNEEESSSLSLSSSLQYSYSKSAANRNNKFKQEQEIEKLQQQVYLKPKPTKNLNSHTLMGSFCGLSQVIQPKQSEEYDVPEDEEDSNNIHKDRLSPHTHLSNHANAHINTNGIQTNINYQSPLNNLAQQSNPPFQGSSPSSVYGPPLASSSPSPPTSPTFNQNQNRNIITAGQSATAMFKQSNQDVPKNPFNKLRSLSPSLLNQLNNTNTSFTSLNETIKSNQSVPRNPLNKLRNASPLLRTNTNNSLLNLTTVQSIQPFELQVHVEIHEEEGEDQEKSKQLEDRASVLNKIKRNDNDDFTTEKEDEKEEAKEPYDEKYLERIIEKNNNSEKLQEGLSQLFFSKSSRSQMSCDSDAPNSGQFPVLNLVPLSISIGHQNSAVRSNSDSNTPKDVGARSDKEIKNSSMNDKDKNDSRLKKNHSQEMIGSPQEHHSNSNIMLPCDIKAPDMPEIQMKPVFEVNQEKLNAISNAIESITSRNDAVTPLNFQEGNIFDIASQNLQYAEFSTPAECYELAFLAFTKESLLAFYTSALNQTQLMKYLDYLLSIQLPNYPTIPEEFKSINEEELLICIKSLHELNNISTDIISKYNKLSTMTAHESFRAFMRLSGYLLATDRQLQEITEYKPAEEISEDDDDSEGSVGVLVSKMLAKKDTKHFIVLSKDKYATDQKRVIETEESTIITTSSLIERHKFFIVTQYSSNK